jgi:large subunit ribosomal protein L4
VKREVHVRLKNEKGTGTARAGSAKNPLFKGVVEQVFDQDQEVIHFKLNKT